MVAPRPRLPKGGQGAHDEAGVQRLQVLVAQAAGLHVPWRIGFQYHIGGGRQTPEEALAVGVVQAQSDAAFRCVVVPERKAPFPVRNIVQKRANGPGLLPAGWLDLDNIGSQVCHELAAVLAFFVGCFQHPEASQRTWDRLSPPPLAAVVTAARLQYTRTWHCRRPESTVFISVSYFLRTETQ